MVLVAKYILNNTFIKYNIYIKYKGRKLIYCYEGYTLFNSI